LASTEYEEKGSSMPPVRPDLQSLKSLLAFFKGLIDSHQPFEEFQHFWGGNEETIRRLLKSQDPANKRLLDLFEQYLSSSGPVREIYSLEIAKADPVDLFKFDCAYDVWALLVEHGRQPSVVRQIE
jgi:hypothetical protein